MKRRFFQQPIVSGNGSVFFYTEEGFYQLGSKTVLNVSTLSPVTPKSEPEPEDLSPKKVVFPKISEKILQVCDGMAFTVFRTRFSVFYYGRLFQSDVFEKNPIKISFFDRKKIDTIFGGMYAIFVYCQNGKLYACGYNTCGELGIGNSNEVNDIVEVNLPRKERIKNMIGGDAFSVLLFHPNESNNTLYITGAVSDFDDPESTVFESVNLPFLKKKIIKEITGGSKLAVLTTQGQVFDCTMTSFKSHKDWKEITKGYNYFSPLETICYGHSYRIFAQSKDKRIWFYAQNDRSYWQTCGTGRWINIRNEHDIFYIHNTSGEYYFVSRMGEVFSGKLRDIKNLYNETRENSSGKRVLLTRVDVVVKIESVDRKIEEFRKKLFENNKYTDCKIFKCVHM